MKRERQTDRERERETETHTHTHTDTHSVLKCFECFQIMSDFIFIAPTYKEQRLYFNAHGKTEYLYRFSFRSANRRNHYWQGKEL